MLVKFKLTMPNAGSWNGKWSGEQMLFARVRTLNKEEAEKIIDKSFIYNWPDGWTACVSVARVDYKEKQRIEKETKGFSGYDWMIESIIKNKKIIIDKK